MGERNDEPSRASGPPLSTDTPVDKAVRFGCGALIGIAVMAYLLMNISGGEGTVILAILIVLLCGVFALAWGDPFFEKMLRLIRWL